MSYYCTGCGHQAMNEPFKDGLCDTCWDNCRYGVREREEEGRTYYEAYPLRYSDNGEVIQYDSEQEAIDAIRKINDEWGEEGDIPSLCLDCQKPMELETDIQLCQKCMEAYDTDLLWKQHDNGEIDALDFNESAQMRNRYRKDMNPLKDTIRIRLWLIWSHVRARIVNLIRR